MEVYVPRVNLGRRRARPLEADSGVCGAVELG